ncbi:MAG: RluA family pseudouridine synthase [Clostridia bacterium]|nr:RluA family pseudouridine synthase [Clostridia bacterium]
MNVIYEDADIIVCVKPYGVLSQHSSDKNNMFDILSDQYGQIFPVHRLDRTTAGIMVFARNRQAAANLSAQIVNKNFEKVYVARVEGKIDPPNAQMDDILYFDRKSNKSYVVKNERKGVKKAKLFYETINNDNDKTLVKILLYTGRTHQIRVQFASRGYPVVGDRRYGSKSATKNINLWSFSLKFLHPKTNMPCYFECNEEF